jgi:flagellar assembly protein FliH
MSMTAFELPAGSNDVSIQPWNAPAINGAGASSRARRMPEDLQGNERRVWQEAQVTGRAAGLQAARTEIDARMRELDHTARKLELVLQALSRPLAGLDDAVHSQIVILAVTLARALVRRELRTEPAQIIGIVRETVALLPASARGVRVLLHPEDAALVRERLVTTGPEQAWTIVDDPVLARGDCRVHTEYAQIDARLEARLNETMCLLLGEQRSVPRAEEPS